MSNCPFAVPAITTSKITLSAETAKLWKAAIWTVRQAGEKFLEAYKATLKEQIPHWKKDWQKISPSLTS
jgi:hypothetical protein